MIIEELALKDKFEPRAYHDHLRPQQVYPAQTTTFTRLQHYTAIPDDQDLHDWTDWSRWCNARVVAACGKLIIREKSVHSGCPGELMNHSTWRCNAFSAEKQPSSFHIINAYKYERKIKQNVEKKAPSQNRQSLSHVWKHISLAHCDQFWKEKCVLDAILRRCVCIVPVSSNYLLMSLWETGSKISNIYWGLQGFKNIFMLKYVFAGFAEVCSDETATNLKAIAVD